MDAFSGFELVRRAREFRAGEITVCKSLEDAGLYTVIKVRKRPEKLLLLEADVEMRDNGGDYMFKAVYPDGGALIVVAPYIPSRRMVDFAAAACPSVQDKVALCMRLVRECMASGMPWWLLYLCLTRENVQMYPGGTVKFDMIIDLDDMNGLKTERDCARRCGALAMEILGLMREHEKLRSNAYMMLKMMERNDSYTTLLQLHRDFDAVYKNPSRTLPLNMCFDWCKAHLNLISLILRATAVAFALIAAAALLNSLAFKDISFPNFHYRGLERIGEINLRE